uniref:Ig-like domain-containing protein n=1 Tax=Hippocampus comes TaxID=109280 RepID=A0A3Q2YHY3_HIPCM
ISQGSTVMFECSLMGIPSPVVSWFKGDKKIPPNDRRYLHSSDGDNHFLKICNVAAQDGGMYTCSAVNVVGETLCRASLVLLSTKEYSGLTRGRELTAVSLGSAIVQPQKFDLLVGNSAADGGQIGKPKPTAEWYKDGERITDSRHIIQEKNAGHFNLLITNASQGDAGEYRCLIQNAAGWIETSALMSHRKTVACTHVKLLTSLGRHLVERSWLCSGNLVLCLTNSRLRSRKKVIKFPRQNRLRSLAFTRSASQARMGSARIRWCIQSGLKTGGLFPASKWAPSRSWISLPPPFTARS